MKPIPPGYCEAADNAAIPGRPWWRPVHGGYARNVGGFNVWPGVPMWMGVYAEAEHRANPRNVFVEPLEWTPGSPTADLRHVVAAVERIDAEHPLPHPGYRAGQVWLWDHGDLRAQEMEPRYRVKRARFQQVTILEVADDIAVTSGRYEFTQGAYGGELYLLHDPLMPSKAPWGPT